MNALLAEILADEGFQSRTAASGQEALWMMHSVPFALVVTDLRMQGISGMELLSAIRRAHPDTQVVMITAFGTIDTAIEAIKRGAYDYVTKPFKSAEIVAVVKRAMEHAGLRREVAALRDQGAGHFHGMVGTSAPLRAVFDYVRRIAKSPASVLISGESGTGKELVARAIHAESGRSGPLVAVNCAAIPETLMEGELFGVRKGAYTDAREDRKGLFQQANEGTIFLDEVGDIPLSLQGKLLRVLQDRVVRRLGDTEEARIDVRVLAATNVDLKAAVADGRFREDLYYRLNVIPMRLPPLRERADDIPLLAETLVARFARDNDKRILGIDDDAMRRLRRHGWPGNVRELSNVLERAVILALGTYITVADLAAELDTGPPPATVLTNGLSGGVTLDELERGYILRVLEESGGNRTLAAQRLGIDRKTLYRKLHRYGMGGDAED
ncbi:MAG: sigma-54-dependent Fis family transcriptional regulator [Nitrospirae bacterium]|nr:sigma-54-dependent Fis family transcriptional regulator [Nitrospirota bacterium]